MRFRIEIAVTLVLVVGPFGCGTPQDEGESFSLVTRVRRSPWNSESSSGEQLVTEHYHIYTTTSNPALLGYFPGFMESAYLNYLRLTQLPPRRQDKRLIIYLMGSRREWALLTENVVKSHLDAYLSIAAGGYCYKGVCVFWDMGGMGTFAVAAHEGLHQFFHHRLRDRLPTWAEEGLCVLAEGYQIHQRRVRFTPDHNPIRIEDLRSIILRDRWRGLRELLPMDPTDVTGRSTEEAIGYYAQLGALLRFLRSEATYRQGLESMIADAEEGVFHQKLKLPPPAFEKLRQRGRIYNRYISEPLFRHYIGGDLDAIDRDFLAFARKIANLD